MLSVKSVIMNLKNTKMSDVGLAFCTVGFPSSLRESAFQDFEVYCLCNQGTGSGCLSALTGEGRNVQAKDGREC